MPRIKDTMTLETHIANAADLRLAAYYLNRVYHRCARHFNVKTKIMVKLEKIAPGVMHSYFADVKSLLDGHYHSVICNAQFEEHGHIYYKSCDNDPRAK